MNRKNILKLTMAGVFAALIYAATALIAIPLPGNGYANLGDCFVILAGFLLGPLYGGAAAGIGSAISDLFLGYGIYAPATFIIKALMAVIVGIMFSRDEKTSVRRLIFAAILAETVMIGGYFLFEIPLYGFGVAAADIIGNLVQGIFGAVSGSLIALCVHRAGLKNRLSIH